MEEGTKKERKSFKKRLDEFFGISALKTSFKVEIVAGIVTFLAMAYILTLNPSLISGDFTQSSPLWASSLLLLPLALSLELS